MAIDFPNSPPPESGDVYTGPNGVSYTFDGIKWIGQEIGSGSILAIPTAIDGGDASTTF